MPTFPVLFSAGPIDPMVALPRIGIGDRVAVYLELDDDPWLSEASAELEADVKRHGRGNGTAVLSADGVEFAMDGESYPATGGRVRGVLTEIDPDDIPHGLSPLSGVARRIRACRWSGGGIALDDVDAVPSRRDAATAPPELAGYLVDIATLD